jgi:hypothetical protein
LKKERERHFTHPLALLLFMQTNSSILMSCPHPRQPHGPFNRNASERSSMKNPEKFKAFVRDGKRFVVRADEKLTAFLELEAAILRR